MKITIDQLEFPLPVKKKINKMSNKKQSKFDKDSGNIVFIYYHII